VAGGVRWDCDGMSDMQDLWSFCSSEFMGDSGVLTQLCLLHHMC